MQKSTTKRPIVKVFLFAVFIASASAHLCSAWDTPRKESSGNPPSALPLVEPLQALIDGPDRIIDLGGETFVVPTRLTITTKHSGKTIQNGRIIFTFTGTVPRVGGMEIVQGRKWWNASGKMVAYPAGKIDLTLRDLVIDGSFDEDFGIQEFNEQTADKRGKGFNLISTVTHPANNIRLERVRMQNGGNSGIAGSFRRLTIRDLTADRIAKHVVGFRGFGGTLIEIYRLSSYCCGNALDLHNDKGFLDPKNPDFAIVKDLIVRNPRGRSKCSGNNFEIYGQNWLFSQDDVVNLNQWPAWDLAKNPRCCHIDGFTALNFWSTGIGMLSDKTTGGDIQFSNLFIDNSLSGIKGQQKYSVAESVFRRVHHRYRSSGPIEQENNVDLAPKSDEYWAQIYRDIEGKLAAFNQEHGTDIKLKYWLPNSVRTLVKSK